LNTIDSVPRLMPLYNARINTSPSAGAGTTSDRISPRPGAVTQKALASQLTTLILVRVGVNAQCSVRSMHNPHDAARRLIYAAAAGCLVVVGAGVAAGSLLPVGRWYPWKALLVFAGLMGIARWFVYQHPFPRLGPANRITIGRAVIVAMTAALIGEPRLPLLAAVSVVAGVTSAVLDGADGWMARRTGMASTFGARFDVETDALLIMALSILVWQHDKAGPWVLVCGQMRYAFVASGWLLPWMAGPLTPTLRGRVVAVGQVAGLGLALLPPVTPPASTLVAAVTAASLTWSFALDVRRLWRGRALQ
jgi:phosphatidylglycerophosphate synthase